MLYQPSAERFFDLLVVPVAAGGNQLLADEEEQVGRGVEVAPQKERLVGQVGVEGEPLVAQTERQRRTQQRGKRAALVDREPDGPDSRVALGHKVSCGRLPDSIGAGYVGQHAGQERGGHLVIVPGQGRLGIRQDPSPAGCVVAHHASGPLIGQEPLDR